MTSGLLKHATLFMLLLLPGGAAAAPDPLPRWHATCPAPTSDGLCVRPGKASRGERCGDASVLPLERLPRHSVKARAVIKLLKASRSPAARFRLIDADLEAYLAIRLPAVLDFSNKDPAKAAASKKSFTRYLTRKGQALGDLRERYLALGRQHGGPWRQAAMLRVAQLYNAFALELATGPIPLPPVPDALPEAALPLFEQKFKSVYCDTLAGKAEALLIRAGEAARACIKKAGQGEPRWTGACEAVWTRVVKGQAMTAALREGKAERVVTKPRPEKRPPTGYLAVYHSPVLALPPEAPTAGDVICRYRSNSWSVGLWEGVPEVASGEGFVKLDIRSAIMAEATLTTGRPGQARVKLEGAGVVLHGQLQGGRYLYPTRPMALNPVTYNNPWASMGWEGGAPGKVRLKLPRPELSVDAVKPYRTAEVPCQAVSLDQISTYQAFEHKLRGGKEKAGIWVHLDSPLPVARRPGGPRLARLPATEKVPRQLFVLDRKGKQRKVLATVGGTVVVGWVPARALKRRGKDPGPSGVLIGKPEPPASARSGTCQHDLPLFARGAAGRVVRVGTVKKQTPLNVTGKVEGKWLAVKLPSASWFKPVEGVSLLVDIGARRSCPGL